MNKFIEETILILLSNAAKKGIYFSEARIPAADYEILKKELDWRRRDDVEIYGPFGKTIIKQR